MERYTVKQGDCILSIAHAYGFFWSTLWDLPENAALKAQRADPSLLLPGDVVVIPDLRPGSFDRPTGARHRFRRKGVPARLRVRFVVNDRPRANEPFVLDVDGKRTTGRTDGDGVVDQVISPDARLARLTIGEGEGRTEHEMWLGHLDPIGEITGVQARLLNLGFPCRRVSGELDGETRDALRAFQSHLGLPVTGEPDAATRGRLASLHDG